MIGMINHQIDMMGNRCRRGCVERRKGVGSGGHVERRGWSGGRRRLYHRGCGSVSVEVVMDEWLC